MRVSQRDEPFPARMQGVWVDAEDPTSKLIVRGAEVACFGQEIAYDYKEIHEVDGALTVTLKITDASREDAFQRENITGLVITPEGEFHAYNVRFAAHFVQERSSQ